MGCSCCCCCCNAFSALAWCADLITVPLCAVAPNPGFNFAKLNDTYTYDSAPTRTAAKNTTGAQASSVASVYAPLVSLYAPFMSPGSKNIPGIMPKAAA